MSISRVSCAVFRNVPEIANGKNARFALKGLVARKVLVITARSFSQSKFRDQLGRLINADCVRFVEKSWVGEPSLQGLEDVLRELEEFQPDYIIALGGGSVIDGAKLAWLFYEHPALDLSDLYRPFAIPPLRGRARFAAIPTTVGTGSEVSSSAILFDSDSKSKKAVVTHGFLPDLVILDPELVSEVPVDVLRTTLMDALSHAIEGYVSKIDNPLADLFSEQAISMIYAENAKFSSKSWSENTLEKFQQAAMLAGLVQNHCVVGFSHAVAHQLGEFDIGHGLANGLLMPSVIEFNSQNKMCSDKYKQLAERSGLPGKTSLIDLFHMLANEPRLHLPITDEQLVQIAENALKDPAARTNPVEFEKDDITKLVQECLM